MDAAVAAEDRELDWPGAWNARDLGGLPAGPDGSVVAGRLARADGLDHLTGRGVEALRHSGVSRIVDLRRAAETAAMPDPDLGPGVRVSAPLPGVDEPGHGRVTLATAYQLMLDGNMAEFGAALRAVASAPPGLVVVHCHAGKDRTGLIVALLLGLAGVSADEIAADYAYRGAGLVREADRVLAGARTDAEREHQADHQATHPSTMRSVLAHLDREYGGAAGYAELAGLTAADVAAIRSRLLDR